MLTGLADSSLIPTGNLRLDPHPRARGAAATGPMAGEAARAPALSRRNAESAVDSGKMGVRGQSRTRYE